MSTSLFEKVGIASMIMMGSVFLSRVIGLLREMVIAYVAGAGAAVDAYQVAFVVPEILNHMVAAGFLSVTFIPIFSRYLAQDNQDEGWRVMSVILSCFGPVLAAAILVAMVAAPEIVALVAPGLQDPALKASAVRMTRIILPAQFFFFAGGLFMAAQFAKENFWVPALAPLLYNALIIAGGLLLGPWLGMEGFAWGALVGALIGNFGLQYWGARRLGMTLALAFEPSNPDLMTYVRLTLPLMLGLTMTFSTEFFFRFFGSYLETGSIAVLNFSLRVMLILVGFFGQAIGTASFPFMARLAAEDNVGEMNRLLNATLRYLSLIIPISALLIVLRHEVVTMLFQRGKFDTAAATLTARVLIYFLAGSFTFSAYTVVVRNYFAVQDTLLPAIYGTLAVLASIPIYWLGMRLMGAGGIALAISLSGLLQVVLLYMLWNRRSHNQGSRAVYGAFARMLAMALVSGLALEWLNRSVLPLRAMPPSFFTSLSVCLINAAIFMLLLVAVGYGLNVQEIKSPMQRLLGRIRRA
jgi:putative peptidoglycan lipid II flippase